MRVPEARTQSIAASSAPPSTEVHQGQMPLREMIRLRARSAAEGRHVLAQDVPGEGVELVELVEVPAVLRACHRHHHQWGDTLRGVLGLDRPGGDVDTDVVHPPACSDRDDGRVDGLSFRAGEEEFPGVAEDEAQAGDGGLFVHLFRDGEGEAFELGAVEPVERRGLVPLAAFLALPSCMASVEEGLP